jgi:formamidopyrimidine-DNA glycosylase
VLHEAIKAGGSSLRDHRRTDGDLGMFQHNFRVYDREGEACPPPYPPPQVGEGREGACGGIVKRIVQNGRSTFYCPACQK